MAEDNKINVRIPDGTGFGLADIEAKAKDFGMNKSEFIMKGIAMMMGFDDLFLHEIQSYSEGLRIPEWELIQKMIAKRMANEEAEYAVYGPSRRVLDEFMFFTDEKGNRRLETFWETLNRLKAQYIEKHEKELVKQLLSEEQYGLVDEEGKDLLIKYRCGQAWLESDEYKKEQERKAETEKYLKEFEEKHPDAARKQKEHLKAERKAARNKVGE